MRFRVKPGMRRRGPEMTGMYPGMSTSLLNIPIIFYLWSGLPDTLTIRSILTTVQGGAFSLMTGALLFPACKPINTRYMNDKKQFYETPIVEVLTVRIELDFLDGTNPVTVDQYDPWENEDI